MANDLLAFQQTLHSNFECGIATGFFGDLATAGMKSAHK